MFVCNCLQRYSGSSRFNGGQHMVGRHYVQKANFNIIKSDSYYMWVYFTSLIVLEA